MTIELGNSNNGIPMGAYTEGGGADASAYHFQGSVATYADLPTNAKQGDVYNVTDTGMNYAWTGTEWDSLGGKVVDIDEYITGSTSGNINTITSTEGKALELSAPTIAVGNNLVNEINGENSQLYLKQGDIATEGLISVTPTATGVKATVNAYSKTESDALLAAKEDTITAIAPVTLNKYIKSNLHNFAYTSDGNSIYQTGNPSADLSYGVNYTGTIECYRAPSEFTDLINAWPSYIDMPLHNQYIYTFPIQQPWYYDTPCFMGKTLTDGSFIPIVVFYDKMLVALSNDYTISGYNIAMTRTDGPYSTYRGDVTANTSFVQFSDNETSISICYPKIPDGSYYQDNIYTTSDTVLMARLREIDTVRFVPTNNFASIGHPADIHRLGMYAYNQSAPHNLDISTLGDNLFDLSGQTVNNYLELNIGSGLKLSDDNKLTLDLPIASDMQKGVVQVDGTTIISNDGVISAIGGGSSTSSNYGVRGDYATRYGILDCPNGIIEYNATGKDITLKQGVVLQCAGTDIKTTIATDITKTLESSSDIVLFYADGDLLECGKVDYQEDTPDDNGVNNYQAWFKPSVQKWYLKSNDTGNVFREIAGTPIANIKLNESNITRVDYIGHRILDDDIIAHMSDVGSLQGDVATLTTAVNNAVTLSGTQTITGAKTFNNDTLLVNTIRNSSNKMYLGHLNGSVSLGDFYSPIVLTGDHGNIQIQGYGMSLPGVALHSQNANSLTVNGLDTTSKNLVGAINEIKATTNTLNLFNYVTNCIISYPNGSATIDEGGANWSLPEGVRAIISYGFNSNGRHDSRTVTLSAGSVDLAQNVDVIGYCYYSSDSGWPVYQAPKSWFHVVDTLPETGESGHRYYVKNEAKWYIYSSGSFSANPIAIVVQYKQGGSDAYWKPTPILKLYDGIEILLT